MLNHFLSFFRFQFSRSAKIRCDRVHPTCRNCRERSTICTYDDSVKGRGQDKNPRIRSRRTAQSGTENKARAHPYQAKRPKRDSAKPVLRADTTSSIPTTSSPRSSGRGKHPPLRRGIDPPSFPAPTADVLESPRDPDTDNFPLADLPSQPQPYDLHLHENLLVSSEFSAMEYNLTS